MRKEHTPSTVAPPFSRYSHGVEVDAARWLLISGQVGVDREGRLAEGAAAQMDQAWRNTLAILDDAGMDAGNLVKITAHLTERQSVGWGQSVSVHVDLRGRQTIKKKK